MYDIEKENIPNQYVLRIILRLKSLGMGFGKDTMFISLQLMLCFNEKKRCPSLFESVYFPID